MAPQDAKKGPCMNRHAGESREQGTPVEYDPLRTLREVHAILTEPAHGKKGRERRLSEALLRMAGTLGYHARLERDWRLRPHSFTDDIVTPVLTGGSVFHAHDPYSTNVPCGIEGCPHSGISKCDPDCSRSGVDGTDIADPDKVWRCDGCGEEGTSEALRLSHSSVVEASE